jgi:hypothetical protein
MFLLLPLIWVLVGIVVLCGLWLACGSSLIFVVLSIAVTLALLVRQNNQL